MPKEDRKGESHQKNEFLERAYGHCFISLASRVVREEKETLKGGKATMKGK